MKITINAPSVINDFNRRGIKPDKEVMVSQGLLQIWLLNQSYLGQVVSGDMRYLGTQAYINTYTPQEIADDICNG